MEPLHRSPSSKGLRSACVASIAASLSLVAGGCTGPAPEPCASSTAPLSACPSGAVAPGIDVSVYQGAVDWDAVAASGIEFAFARVSDGVGTPDSRFATNWTGMRAAGLARGAYQFFRASEDPSAQAALVLSALDEAGGIGMGDLPVVMDIETADGESSDTVRSHMTTWLGAVAATTGKVPIVYTNAATAPVLGSAFGAYPLWVAAWETSCPTVPAGWSTWTMWQYADTGSVDGIEGAVDLDEFDGMAAELSALERGAAPDAGGDAMATTTNMGDGGAGMSMGGGVPVDLGTMSTACSH
jgi:lysozyme